MHGELPAGAAHKRAARVHLQHGDVWQLDPRLVVVASVRRVDKEGREVVGPIVPEAVVLLGEDGDANERLLAKFAEFAMQALASRDKTVRFA